MNDEIIVFEAGKGINCVSLNANFELMKNMANSNESELSQIASTTLMKDGSNIDQSLVNVLNGVNLVTLHDVEGDVSLTDNTSFDISLSGNSVIVLPTPPVDNYSHTITCIVNQNGFTLDTGTTNIIIQPQQELDINSPYSLMYIWSKIDNKWYAAISG